MMTRAQAVEVHAAMSIVSGVFHLNNAPVRLTPYHIKVSKKIVNGETAEVET